jgi:pilus assembly protein CpaC
MDEKRRKASLVIRVLVLMTALTGIAGGALAAGQDNGPAIEAPVAQKEAPVSPKETVVALKETPVVRKEAAVIPKEAAVVRKATIVVPKETPVTPKEAPVVRNTPAFVVEKEPAAKNVAVTAGRSVTLRTEAPVKRISVAAPDTADALVLSSTQVHVTGKTPGTTNITLWGKDNGIIATFNVEVTPDVSGLKMKLHEFLPDERGIKVTAAQDSITLSGTVSGPGYMTQALAVAEAYAPRGKDGKPKLVNLLEIGGVQQVMVEVRVSEMSRTLTKQLGINFSTVSASGKQFGVSLLNNLTTLPSAGFPTSVTTSIANGLTSTSVTPNPLTVSNTVNGVMSFLGNGATWTMFIDALQDTGLLKVLAEPTLITLSGKTATFLAGGEFPVPVPQPGITAIVTIQYKPYGVGLNFTPTVLSDGRINMAVAPEVSELDFSQAVSLQGYIIPSITTRRVSTTVELADGQSFAIAGLLQEQIKEDIQKYPLLGDIPILGALFRSSSFSKNETELVIIVTPHLVKPLDLSKQTLPTDAYVEPSDFDFYLQGRLEGRDGGKAAPALPRMLNKGGLEGDFGYIMPGKEE